MRWTFPLGRLFGIPIKAHVTLLILLVVLVPAFGGGEGGLASMLRGLIMMIVLFGSVLLHELGHALAARRYGVKTREIVLLPIGGVAMLADNPERPIHELWIALAGPLTSLLLAGICLAAYEATGAELLSFAGALNLILGVFNLLPAFPLDGGRVLRAGLAHRMGIARGTRIAAAVGRVLALGLVAAGAMYDHWILALIGAFVFLAAGSEERQVRVQELIRNSRVTDLMEPVLRVFNATSTTDEIIQAAQQEEASRVFPVTFGDKVLGVVHCEPLLNALAQGLRPDFLHEVLDRNVVTTQADTPLADVLQAMGSARSQAAVVLGEGGVKGVLMLDTLARHLEGPVAQA